MTDMEQPQPPASAQKAARASWAGSIIVYLLIAVGRRVGAGAAVECIALAIGLGGFALGIVALCGISKYGVRGILASALAGITVNSLLLWIIISNFLRARAG